MEKKVMSRKEMKRCESVPTSPQRSAPARSQTLPANSRLSPVVVNGSSGSSGGGFFMKLKRCLRLGNKGRYSISSIHGKSSKRGDLSLERNGDQTPTQSMRYLRRNIPDKEEVVLLHKGPRTSDYGKGEKCKLLESVSEDTIVHIVCDSRNDKCEGAEKISVGESEENETLDEVDEMDPGYETLDEIRKKVQLQMKKNSACTDLKNVPEEQVEVQKSSKVHISGQGSEESCVRDSGVTTPQTDSPDSYRESNTQSVNSSVLSESTGIADESGIEVDMLDLDNINMFEHFNNTSSSNKIPPEHQQRHNSESFIQNDSQIIEEDLYANPKVISRKRSQKQQQTESEAPPRLSLASLKEDHLDLSLPDKSVSEGDVSGNPWRGSSEESDQSAPPLPERKYTLINTDQEETSELETLGAEGSGKCVHSEAKADVETSEESTLDAVSDCDVITDNELGDKENTEPLDDGYQSIKDVQAQKVSSYPSEPHSEQTKQNVSENTFKLEDDQIIIHVSAEKTESETVSVKVDPPLDCSRQPSDYQEPFLTCVELIQKCPDNSNLTQSAVILKENSVNANSVDECACKSKNQVISSELKTGDTQIPSELKAMDKKISSELKTTDQVISSKVKTIDKVSCDHTPPVENVASSDDCTPGAKGSNHVVEHKQEMLNKATAVVFDDDVVDDGGFDVTLREKSSTGQHNVVVIKLHESAHEDAEESSFSDLEPVHCSHSDLMNQLKHIVTEAGGSGCHGKDAATALDVSRSGQSENRKKEEDFFFIDDEPIHMTLEELRQPRCHNESTSVIASSVAQQNMTTSTSNNVSVFRNDIHKDTSSNELSTSDYHQAFLESMAQLKDCGWYWGPLSYSEAESMLMAKPDGSFLVRDSSSENYILSLSFKCRGTVCHTRIEHHKGVFSFFSQPESHGTSTIRRFIEQAIEFSHTGQFLYFLRPLIPGSPPVAIQLLYPVSRFLKVPSLQHMCRFLILRWVRRDHIDNLPVPEKVKNYLREHQYYVESLEEEAVDS